MTEDNLEKALFKSDKPWEKYYTESSKRQFDIFMLLYTQNRFPHQRKGQAFCNHFGITNQKIFYCPDAMFTYSFLLTNSTTAN